MGFSLVDAFWPGLLFTVKVQVKRTSAVWEAFCVSTDEGRRESSRGTVSEQESAQCEVTGWGGSGEAWRVCGFLSACGVGPCPLCSINSSVHARSVPNGSLQGR